MGLFRIWSTFIFLMGIAEPDDAHYFLFCAMMFYYTYLYNQIYPIKLTTRLYAGFIFIPSVQLCWIGYVYNYLLSMEPFSDEIVVFFISIYLYILIYMFWECK